jgi:2-polyprenyl-6-methoxyphenol hydroxylase-like FAD-dependent oxidoreductase
MGASRYDVIVVGARVAGAATAMLLARQGLRVLAVDRVSFPCDTISSHQLQVPGVALLHRWGLLGKLAEAGTPPARRVRFDADGGVVMDSISAQGMTNALRDASYLSAAIVAGLGGSQPLADALHGHQRRRDRAIRGMYDFTLRLAAFPPASVAFSLPSPLTSTRPTGSSAPSPASCRRGTTSPSAR